MTDNVQITAGSGTTIGTEGTTINAVAVQVQQMKATLGTRDNYVASQSGRDVTGSGDGAAFVDPRPLTVSPTVTPTITASSAYSTGQCLGALMSFTSASRASGGSLMLMAVNLVDADKQDAAIDLVLFNSAPTATTDKTTFNPSKADLQKCVGVVNLGYYSPFSANAVAAANNIGLEILLSGTSTLTGQLVLRATPTYTTTSSIVVALTILQD
jgi:hypothetical protein